MPCSPIPERFSVSLPRPVEQLRELVRGHADVLDAVDTPVLVHFDLWVGNIPAARGAVSGLVDAERAFWGDPLAEMVSVALFADIEQDPAFLGSYRAGGRFDHVRSRALGTRLALLPLLPVPDQVGRACAARLCELRAHGHGQFSAQPARWRMGLERRAMVKFITRHLNSALRALTP